MNVTISSYEQQMKCIVLSGATVPFVKLVKAIDQPLADTLSKYGFDKIEVQYGLAESSFDSTVRNISGFSFDPEIKKRIETSNLVISHAGTGSIFDSLERGYGNATRRVVVVVNTDLMDNHQIEIARKLESEGCVMVCEDPLQLGDAVVRALNRNFTKLSDPVSLQPLIDEVL